MAVLHPQYITDSKGKKISVILPIKEFEHILEQLDELEDIRLYDESKADNGLVIPVDEAFAMIEKKRKKSK